MPFRIRNNNIVEKPVFKTLRLGIIFVFNSTQTLFIFSNRSGEFFNFELPFNNIAQLIPGCRMVQTATIAGKLSLANLYDGNPLTTDLTSQLRSDTSITCARHFGGDKYSANMGVKFRGAVDGERL